MMLRYSTVEMLRWCDDLYRNRRPEIYNEGDHIEILTCDDFNGYLFERRSVALDLHRATGSRGELVGVSRAPEQRHIVSSRPGLLESFDNVVIKVATHREMMLLGLNLQDDVVGTSTWMRGGGGAA